jgi:hypothetical protein
MAPPDFKPASSSGDRPLSNLSRLTIKELQDFLDADYINFEANSSKPKLQALFALSHLGFLNAGDTLKRDFLAALTLFCQISVSGQIRILKEKGLDTSGLKGDHIEVWIRAKSDEPVEKP